MKQNNLAKLLGIALVVAIIATGVFYGLFVTKLSSNTGGGKMVVLVGVDDLVVVETDDALLITTRSRSQEIGTVVKKLSDAGREELI